MITENNYSSIKIQIRILVRKIIFARTIKNLYLPPISKITYMKFKLFILSLLAIALAACSGNENYAYNEKAASNYFSVSEQFENTYKELNEGDIKASSVRNLRNNTNNVIENMNEIKNDMNIGESAAGFHGKALEYFNLVSKDFSDLADSYVNLDCDCPEKKDSIKALAKDLYNKASTIENQMLEEQLKFMDKVGLKPAK